MPGSDSGASAGSARDARDQGLNGLHAGAQGLAAGTQQFYETTKALNEARERKQAEDMAAKQAKKDAAAAETARKKQEKADEKARKAAEKEAAKKPKAASAPAAVGRAEPEPLESRRQQSLPPTPETDAAFTTMSDAWINRSTRKANNGSGGRKILGAVLGTLGVLTGFGVGFGLGYTGTVVIVAGTAAVMGAATGGIVAGAVLLAIILAITIRAIYRHRHNQAVGAGTFSSNAFASAPTYGNVTPRYQATAGASMPDVTATQGGTAKPSFMKRLGLG